MSSRTRIQTQGVWPRIQTLFYDTLLLLVSPKILISILFSVFLSTPLEMIELDCWRVRAPRFAEEEAGEEGKGGCNLGRRAGEYTGCDIDHHHLRASGRGLGPGLHRGDGAAHLHITTPFSGILERPIFPFCCPTSSWLGWEGWFSYISREDGQTPEGLAGGCEPVLSASWLSSVWTSLCSIPHTLCPAQPQEAGLPSQASRRPWQETKGQCSNQEGVPSPAPPLPPLCLSAPHPHPQSLQAQEEQGHTQGCDHRFSGSENLTCDNGLRPPTPSHQSATGQRQTNSISTALMFHQGKKGGIRENKCLKKVSLLGRGALGLPTQNHKLGDFQQLVCPLSQLGRQGTWKPSVSRTSLPPQALGRLLPCHSLPALAGGHIPPAPAPLHRSLCLGPYKDTGPWMKDHPNPVCLVMD